jgi:hypothetical protein
MHLHRIDSTSSTLGTGQAVSLSRSVSHRFTFAIEREEATCCLKKRLKKGRLVSAGLERLVYTEKVGGSNPSAPTAVVDSMCIAGPVVSGGSSFLPWQTS